MPQHTTLYGGEDINPWDECLMEQSVIANL